MTSVRVYQQLATLTLGLLLAACGASTVNVQGQYPVPNVNKLPLTLGVYYDDSLRNYSYIEYSETGAAEYEVNIGQTHLDFFSTVLPGLFENVVVLESAEATSVDEVDAVFIPLIEDFQLALPQKTKLDAYEAWIKYNMRLESKEGERIADWVVTSYGRTPVGGLRSIGSAINDAGALAMRDLGRSIIDFSNVPEIKSWLERRFNMQIADPIERNPSTGVPGQEPVF